MSAHRLNILVDAHCFDQEHEGSRRFITEIYRVLQHKKQIKLHLAAYDITKLKNVFNSADIVFIPYKSRSSVIRLLYDVPRIIKKYRIDYAHFQYLGPFIRSCHQIITIHDMLYLEKRTFFPSGYRLIRTILFKHAAKHADILTTVSEYSRTSISNFTGVPAEKIDVIANGVGKEFFHYRNKDQSGKKTHSTPGFEKFILFVSRIEPRKNHVNLVRAFVELRLYEKKYHLLMVGCKSIPVAALKKLITRIPDDIKGYIHFIEQVSETELTDLYQSADLFVYPSLAEGFGIPPLEAAASGIPVVCSNATAMKSYTFFGKNHIDPDDINLLKERISDTLEYKSPYDLQQVSELIQKEYSWQDSAEKFYQNIMQHAVLNERKCFTLSMENINSTVIT